MFAAALRPAARVAFKPVARSSVRAIATTPIRRSGHPEPSIFGPGAKSGEVPTDENQSTGLERLQVLGAIEGVDVFDYKPLDSSRIGTKADPIKVFSWVRVSPHVPHACSDLLRTFCRSLNVSLAALARPQSPTSCSG